MKMFRLGTFSSLARVFSLARMARDKTHDSCQGCKTRSEEKAGRADKLERREKPDEEKERDATYYD